MALTIAEVAHPNAAQTVLSAFAPFKAKIIDVTFDDDYPTLGEPLTAVALGWNGVFGAIPLSLAANADAELAFPVHVAPNASQSQVTIQGYHYDGDATGDPVPLGEITDEDDLTGFSVRLLVIGF